MPFNSPRSRPVGVSGLLLLHTLFAGPSALAQTCSPPSSIITMLSMTPSSIVPGESALVRWSWNSAPCVEDATGIYQISNVSVSLQCGSTTAFFLSVAPNTPTVSLTVGSTAATLTGCTWQLSIEIPSNSATPIILASTNNVNVISASASSSLSSSASTSASSSASSATVSASLDNHTAPSYPTSTSIPDSGPSVAVIAGGIVGGVVVLAAFIAVAFVAIRRRRRPRTDSVWDKCDNDDLETSHVEPPPPRDHLYVSPVGKKVVKNQPTVQREASQRYPRASSVDIVAYASGHVEDSPPNSSKQGTLGGTLEKYFLAPARRSTPSIFAYHTETPEPPIGRFKPDKDALAKYKVRDSPLDKHRPPNSRR